MEYFYKFQDWLYQTPVYQEVLKELPEPLNNIYFDTIVALVIVLYLLFRIIESIYMFFYRRRIRKERRQEQKERMELENKILKNQQQAQEKDVRFGRFMDYMDYLYASRMTSQEYPEETYNEASTPNKRLSKKWNLLGMKKKKPLLIEQAEEVVTDYDSVMESHAYDEMREQDFEARQRLSKEQMYSQLHSLDESLRVKPVEEIIEDSYSQSDVQLEKQKARARKQQEKERKREEQRQARRQKRGEWHGK